MIEASGVQLRVLKTIESCGSVPPRTDPQLGSNFPRPNLAGGFCGRERECVELIKTMTSGSAVMKFRLTVSFNQNSKVKRWDRLVVFRNWVFGPEIGFACGKVVTAG